MPEAFQNLLRGTPLSHTARTLLLARIAHLLTVSARGTYEVGTENILKPSLLRSYNELLHRVTAALRDHVNGDDGMPLEAVLEMMAALGKEHNITAEMQWVLKQAQSLPLPTEH